MRLLMVFIGFAAMAAINLPGMIKKKLWRDLVVYLLFFLAVLTLAILMALGIKVPSPIKAVQAFYRDILHLSFQIS